MKPGIRLRRALWSAVIFLVLIGVVVAVRRLAHLVPIVAGGYHPPAVASNPVAARFAALDDLFARYPILTLVHIVPGLLFMMLGPLQFSSTIRARHLRLHRLNGRNDLGISLNPAQLLERQRKQLENGVDSDAAEGAWIQKVARQEGFEPPTLSSGG